MAPATTQQLLLSPAELSYIHSSLSLQPPIRPDSRTPTQFRPLVAESDILPNANGSARICFADGTEAITGVKVQMEKSAWKPSAEHGVHLGPGGGGEDGDEEDDESGGNQKRDRRGVGENSWVEVNVDIPGYRDDDTMPVFLAAMLTEALLATGTLKNRLWITERYYWKLYIDILLLSPPLSYPLPLLSLTTHLALLSARLPALISGPSDDPLFNDDWNASHPLYPRTPQTSNSASDHPPITLLVMSVNSNIIFDPSKEELAVAESVLAISVARTPSTTTTTSSSSTNATNDAPSNGSSSNIRLLAIRTVDLPSRFTPPGIPDAMNAATGGSAPVGSREAAAVREGLDEDGVWRPPRGGVGRAVLGRMIKAVVEKRGVAEEVFEALEGVDTGT
ncbi:MAG: hypothetical protein Q9165_003423 [Trypethelium subeluteriae]